MQITAVQVGNILYPLTEGQPLPIVVGNTVRVFFAFNYRMLETSDIRIWASFYKYSFGILDRQGQTQTKGIITLQKALTYQPYEGVIDIVVGDMPVAIYGLICELPDYDVYDNIDDSIEVAAAPGIFDMIGPLLMIGLMVGLVSMMTPMMKEGGT